MRKVSVWQRIRYWFDNLMSKGSASLLLLLAVITAAVVFIGGFLAVILGGADGKGEEPLWQTIWFTLMHAINTGVLAKEEGTVAYLAVMTVVTLVGIFITSFLIGTISNAIKEKVTNLQRGKSRVIEKDHIVIIGFDENITSMIEELVYANSNRRDAVVVIMADEDKVEMENIISDRVADMGNLRVVCRSGKPDNRSDLLICSLDTCKSVIVNINDDFMTVKAILLCKALLDECGNQDACIIATVRDPEVIHPAKIAGGERVEILNFQKTIARLMVQSERHPGMSEILAELLSFQGNEIYVEDNPHAVGLSLGEINLRLAHSTAIGIVRHDTPILNGDTNTVFETGDKLILIAPDDGYGRLRERASIDETVFEQEPNVRQEPHTLLILGYTDMLKQILIEENAYAAPNSKVMIAAEFGKINAEALPTEKELSNIQVDIHECGIYKRRVLEQLLAEQPSSIMLVSDVEIHDEEADARTLMLQLHLNDIAAEIGTDIPLTIEMNSTRNQRLSQMMRATDFVVSSRVTAKMMVQIAEQRHNKAIFDCLLSDDGASIYMKPMTRYVKTDKPLNYYTLRASAARYGEIAIGYKKFTDNHFTIELNPPIKQEEVFSEQDELIVIAKR